VPLQLRIFVEPQQGASYDDQLAVARAAEAHGFDAFFRSDHLQAFGGRGLPGPTDAWITLAGLARDTSTIRLGTMVSPVTFRYPGMLAIAVAQVDAMSGGRVELGVGAGWFDGEHAANGIPFPPVGQRVDLLEDQLAILHGMWGTAEGERFTYEGRGYSVVDSPGLPKPVQQPRVPIIVGSGGGPRLARLTARYADEWNAVFMPLEGFVAGRDRLRAACEAAGRDPASLRCSAAQTICCGADEAELERRAANIHQTPDQVRRGGVGGTPDEVVERLRAFAAAGVARMYLQVLDMRDLDHLALLAESVMPHV